MSICTRASVVGVFVLAGLAGLISGQGCPMPAAEQMPTENPIEDSTEDPTEGPIGDSGLTDAQKLAVDVVATQLEAVGQALASFMDLVDPRVTAAESGTVETFGTCPAVTAALTEDETGVVVIFDYGSGCSSSVHGGATAAGTFTAGIILPVEPITSSKTISLVITDAFSIGGVTVVGSAQLTPEADTEAGSTLEGTMTFTTDTVGQALGSAEIAFDLSTSTITLIDASLTVRDTTEMTETPDTNSFDVTVTNLAFEPGTDGNFFPQAGSVAFDVDGNVTSSLVGTFTEQPRAHRTVQVSVDDAAAVDYDIPE